MQDKKKIFWFCAKFFLIFGIFYYAILLVNISFFENAIAAFQANLLGLNFKENQIFVNNSIFLIVSSCTGVVSTIILGSIIFSLKKPQIKEKAAIFLAGTLLLMIVNQFRLYFVLWSAILFGVQVAELVHIVSWFATTVAIIFAWFYFTKRITKIEDFDGFL